MNFAAARPLGLPRVLAPPPEEAQKAKTPTPEPFDSETRKVSPNSCCTMLFLRVNHNQGMGASGDLSLSIPILPQASRDQIQADHFSPEASCFYSPSPSHCVVSSIGFWPPPFPIWIQSHHSDLPHPSFHPSSAHTKFKCQSSTCPGSQLHRELVEISLRGLGI